MSKDKDYFKKVYRPTETCYVGAVNEDKNEITGIKILLNETLHFHKEERETDVVLESDDYVVTLVVSKEFFSKHFREEN